jgi:hypothetical protein
LGKKPAPDEPAFLYLVLKSAAEVVINYLAANVSSSVLKDNILG